MKCEEFLKQWQNDDNLSADMTEHLSVCESCRAKVKDYNDILLYIKEDKLILDILKLLCYYEEKIYGIVT